MYIFIIFYQVLCLIFICYVLGPKKKHEDIEFQKQLINILSESNQPANGFLLHLGDILERLPYKERRTLQKEILDLAYKAEERAELNNLILIYH